MLPRTCDQLPCRNIDVNSDEASKRAGTMPWTCRNIGSTSVGSASS